MEDLEIDSFKTICAYICLGKSSCILSGMCTYLFVVVVGLTAHLWDLSSPTRDQTLAPCSGSADS